MELAVLVGLKTKLVRDWEGVFGQLEPLYLHVWQLNTSSRCSCAHMCY
jgi:hypothetical protein